VGKKRSDMLRYNADNTWSLRRHLFRERFTSLSNCEYWGTVSTERNRRIEVKPQPQLNPTLPQPMRFAILIALALCAVAATATIESSSVSNLAAHELAAAARDLAVTPSRTRSRTVRLRPCLACTPVALVSDAKRRHVAASSAPAPLLSY
jgi:hypothetical protein